MLVLKCWSLISKVSIVQIQSFLITGFQHIEILSTSHKVFLWHTQCYINHVKQRKTKVSLIHSKVSIKFELTWRGKKMIGLLKALAHSFLTIPLSIVHFLKEQTRNSLINLCKNWMPSVPMESLTLSRSILLIEWIDQFTIQMWLWLHLNIIFWFARNQYLKLNVIR